MMLRAHISASAAILLATLATAGTASAETFTGDYGGADVTVAPGDVVDGDLTNVGTFTVPAGVVASIGPSGTVSVQANTIRVEGEIDGTGAGFDGGNSSAQSSGTTGSGPGGGSGGIAQQCAHPTGGGGGAYGGAGGAGRNSLNAVFAPGGLPYGSATDFADLRAGSGGGGGGSFLCSLNAIGGRGGSGGGAVGLQALTVEISGTIRVDGARGGDANPSTLSAGPAGGGGGSAGTIIVVGNDVSFSGLLSASGGAGGDIVADPSQTFAGGGGGGAGGRIKVEWRDTFVNSGSTATAGGEAGLSGILGGAVVSDDGGVGSLEVVRQNLPPVAQNLAITTDEEVPVAADLVATDPNGDTLTYTVSSPSDGAISGTAPNLVYTPNSEFSGVDSFTFQVTDPTGLVSNSATVTVTVLPVNDAPVASDVATTTLEDTPVDISIIATDADGDPLVFTAREPSNGSVVALGSGSFRYVPDLNFNGADSFAVVVSDGSESTVANVDIAVTPVNDAPVAADVTVSTPEETPRSFTVSASDVDGDSLTYSAATPSSGSITGSGPTFTYQPAADFTGTVGFDVVVSDGALTDVARVMINVTPVNDPPVVADMSLTVDEDSSVSQALVASDPESDTLTFTAGAAANGVAQTSGNIVSYTPDSNFNGTDTFQVTVSDGVDTAIARVNVTVRPVNDAPEASDLSVSTAEDVDAVVTLIATDVDNDPLTFHAETPAAGSVTINGTTATFTPPQDQNGTFTFVYRANDGTVDSAAATVTIDVGPENDPPVWIAPTPDDGQRFDVDEGTVVSWTLAADEPDGDLVTYDVSPLPAGASFDAVSGIFSWEPTWRDGGEVDYTLTATDGASTIARTVTIDVTVPDSDSDGVPDTREIELGLDPNSPDSDGDSIADLYELVDPVSPVDTDGDGVIDALDDDSDGDGIGDEVEAGDDDLDTDPVDRDGDGTPDFRDLDSDDDQTGDVDDNCPFVPNGDQADVDGDGIGDLCDLDTDGDGLADALEISIGFNPRDRDTDGDFIDDFTEYGFGLNASDVDSDGVFDGLDDDSDDDGISDADEAGDEALATLPVDTDFDGVADFRDPDSDDDGVQDDTDNCRIVFNTDQTDTDANGVGDACDGDTDGDGVPNDADNCPLVANPDQSDFDDDGMGDACDPSRPAEPGEFPEMAPIVTGDLVGGTPLPLAPPTEEPDDIDDPFGSSYLGGAGGCSTTESKPPAMLLFLLLGFVALRRRRN